MGEEKLGGGVVGVVAEQVGLHLVGDQAGGDMGHSVDLLVPRNVE